MCPENKLRVSSSERVLVRAGHERCEERNVQERIAFALSLSLVLILETLSRCKTDCLLDW